MLRDIRWRIAVPYIILILIVVGGLSLYLSRAVREAQLDVLQEDLRIEAGVVAENVGPLLNSPTELDDVAEEWSELLQVRVTFIAIDGTVLGESHEDRMEMDNHLDRPEVQQALNTGQGSSVRYSQTVGSEMIYAAVPVMSGGEVAGFARIAVPFQEVEASTAQLRQVFLTTGVLAVAFAAVLAVLIAGRTSRSIRRLTQTARRISAGDLDARLYVTSPDEIGDLTRAFNQMADQLREQVNDLAEERGRLAAVLENMADGVLITDNFGQVSLMNPAAVRLLDAGDEESVGRSFAEVARHHELIELWRQGWRENREQVAAVELDRRGTFIQMIVTPLGSAGQQDCLIILQDLTRVRRLETVRRDFVSNISHELRTPLASLKVLVQTLIESAMDDPPAARRFLDRADQEVDALTQMVEELLELSRIESGMVPLRLKPIRVSDVILVPLERLRPQAERRGLSLTTKLKSDLPLVLVDGPRVQQVVGNLVHNAIKFTSPGGKIAIQAKFGGDGSTVIVSVRDTGAGIPPDEQERIFERFYKADRARSSGGTGLGLAIARHIVQVHGGHLWVKSKEGKGSTFFFTLPVAEHRF